MREFGVGGGFVFAAIHNVQSGIPTKIWWDSTRRLTNTAVIKF